MIVRTGTLSLHSLILDLWQLPVSGFCKGWQYRNNQETRQRMEHSN